MSIIGSVNFRFKNSTLTRFFVVVPKRDDVNNRNDLNNYTNWIDTVKSSI